MKGIGWKPTGKRQIPARAVDHFTQLAPFPGLDVKIVTTSGFSITTAALVQKRASKFLNVIARRAFL